MGITKEEIKAFFLWALYLGFVSGVVYTIDWFLGKTLISAIVTALFLIVFWLYLYMKCFVFTRYV